MQTKVNIHKIKLYAVLYLLLASFFYVPTQGQSNSEEIFRSVPPQLRSRLVERLTSLVEYQRTQQWGRQFDLLSELITQGKSKEEFVKLNKHYYTEVVPDDLILDFTPKSTTAHSESPDYGEWTIYGCAKLRKKGHTIQLYASVSAYREKKDWYFSPVGIITPVDGSPEPCPYSSAVIHPLPYTASVGKKTKGRRQR
jgi:hypothetical protein